MNLSQPTAATNSDGMARRKNYSGRFFFSSKSEIKIANSNTKRHPVKRFTADAVCRRVKDYENLFLGLFAQTTVGIASNASIHNLILLVTVFLYSTITSSLGFYYTVVSYMKYVKL